MRFLIILISITLIKPCGNSDISTYYNILTKLQTNCDLFKSKSFTIEFCDLKLCSKTIPINITPFHFVVDSMNLIKTKDEKDSFISANLFDLNNHKNTFQNQNLDRFDNKNKFNIKLYCSDIINGLITCEAIESSSIYDTNDLIFGQSLLFLFKVIDSDNVKLIDSVIINNN